MPEELCPICEGVGLRVVERADGTRAAVPCDCRVARRSARMIQQARIPQRYAHCTLDSYDTQFPSSNRTLTGALVQARSFVGAYPFGTNGNGLLLTGSIGVGKTHLAVGMLQALIGERGAKGLFFDYRDLLKQVQNSYNRSVDVTELEILQPVFEAEVLVLDELGAVQTHRLGLGYGRAHAEHPLQRPPHHHHHDQLHQPCAAGCRRQRSAGCHP